MQHPFYYRTRERIMPNKPNKARLLPSGIDLQGKQKNKKSQLVQNIANELESCRKKYLDLIEQLEDAIVRLDDLLNIAIDEIGNQTGRAISAIEGAKLFLADLKLRVNAFG
jgi:hypothetical protein